MSGFEHNLHRPGPAGEPPDQSVSDIRWRASANTDSNPIIKVGFWSVGVMMGVFMLWATLFPLSSAIVTPGTLISDGRNKVIQHGTGGRIRELFVTEGQLVSKGQPVLAIDDTQARADLTKLQARYSSLSALKIRLDAERSGGLRGMERARGTPQKGLRGTVSGRLDMMPTGSVRPTPSLRDGFGSSFSLVFGHGSEIEDPPPTIVAAMGMPPVADPTDELFESQKDAYLSGRKLLSEQIRALKKKAETLSKQRDGLLARVDAQKALLDMATREFERLKPLASKGFVARNRLNERERTVLELTGSVKSLELDVIGIENQIGEVNLQMGKARVESADVAYKEFTKIVGEMAEIKDSLKAARAIVDGSTIRATADGILIRLTANTVGGLVGAGDKIAEIVPEDAPLVVQGRVSPGDIDYVQIGHEADIAVTAFNRRIDDMLKGRVIYKSADAEKDEKTGEPYFAVRLEITGVAGKGRSRLGDLQAGMQSEIYIHTGSRTFMTYLTKPMLDSFRRAFREQ